MLGARGDGLQAQYIVVNVRHIDAEKLKQALGTKGLADAGLSAALTIVDSQPRAALDLGLPIAKRYLRDNLGVDAELTAANVPPPVRQKSEFFGGAVFGAGAVALFAGIGYGAWRLVFRRLFGAA